MKAFRFCSITVLVVALVLGFSWPAAAKGALPVNIFASALDGIIDAEEYTQVLPDGNPFTPYALPKGRTLIMQTLFVSFSTADTITFPVKFIIENSTGSTPSIFAWNLTQSSNTSAYLTLTLPAGLPVNTKPVMKVVDSDSIVVPGTLKVRVLGIVQ
jgi:hypothetical protein